MIHDSRLYLGEFCLPICVEKPPAHYTMMIPNVDLPNIKWLDNHKGLFSWVKFILLCFLYFMMIMIMTMTSLLINESRHEMKFSKLWHIKQDLIQKMWNEQSENLFSRYLSLTISTVTNYERCDDKNWVSVNYLLWLF